MAKANEPMLLPHVQRGDLLTASSFNAVIDAINGQFALMPWKCPYCATMNEGTQLECNSCRAPRPGVT